MNPVKFALAAATLVLLGGPAVHAQQQPSQPSGQGVGDILNRAQNRADKKAVEDLIGRLRGAPHPGQPAPAGAPPVAASAPPPTGAPPAPATASAPATATAPSGPAPIGPAPAPAPDLAAGAPPPPASAPDSTPPADQGAATAGAPPVPPQAGEAATPAAAPAAPASPPPRTASRSRRGPTAAPVAGAVGAPIGPQQAFPAPIGPAGPTEAEMKHAPELAAERGMPAVDIEVLFDYDSAEISKPAAASLEALGKALADPRLAGRKFVLAGHTDKKGRASYNLDLSERRAQAVRVYLVRTYKIPPSSLIARGYGSTRLKNPADPLGAENRRVQVINWTGAVAGRQ
ncbi:MAG: OmpA family protein [Proteobacteria bacterium]|nr:OmpA family protein [Pseudomonadota bacterium]